MPYKTYTFYFLFAIICVLVIIKEYSQFLAIVDFSWGLGAYGLGSLGHVTGPSNTYLGYYTLRLLLRPTFQLNFVADLKTSQYIIPPSR